MAVAVVAADGVRPSFHLQSAGADKGVVRFDLALFQRHGGCDALKDRARFIAERNRLVAPLFVELFISGGFQFIPFQRFQTGKSDRVGDGKGVVRVIVPFGGHGKHFPGFDIHHNARCPVADVVFHHRSLQAALQKLLDCTVNGEHQIAAILGVDDGFVVKVHIAADSILCRHPPSRDAFEIFFIIGFQAVQAVVVGSGKAEHGGREVPRRIITFGVRVNDDAVQVMFIDKFRYRLKNRTVDLAFERFILSAGMPGLFVNGFTVDIQNFRKAVRNQAALFLVLDIDGRQADGPYRRALGQRFHIAVIDRPTVCIDCCFRQLLADRLFLIKFILYKLEIDKLCNQSAGHYERQHNHNSQHSFPHRFCRAFCHCGSSISSKSASYSAEYGSTDRVILTKRESRTVLDSRLDCIHTYFSRESIKESSCSLSTSTGV